VKKEQRTGNDTYSLDFVVDVLFRSETDPASLIRGYERVEKMSSVAVVLGRSDVALFLSVPESCKRSIHIAQILEK
jgi:hypothetical protein